MNIFIKMGKIIFKVFAIFLILLALLLEHFSKVKHIPKNESEYSQDNNMRKIFNKYPHIKHYGY